MFHRGLELFPRLTICFFKASLTRNVDIDSFIDAFLTPCHKYPYNCECRPFYGLLLSCYALQKRRRKNGDGGPELKTLVYLWTLFLHGSQNCRTWYFYYTFRRSLQPAVLVSRSGVFLTVINALDTCSASNFKACPCCPSASSSRLLACGLATDDTLCLIP